MAKLIQCPACKKQVSIEATACPKCGQPITEAVKEEAVKKEQKGKRALKGCLWIVVALFVVSGLANLLTDKPQKADQAVPSAPVTAPAPVPAQSAPQLEEAKPQPAAQNAHQSEPVFSLKVGDFAANYDKVAKADGSKQRTKIGASQGDSFEINITNNNGAVVTINAAGDILSVIHIGIVDGTPEAAKNILEGMLLTIGAVKPEWPATQRGDVLRKMGLLKADSDLSKPASTVMGGIKFSFIPQGNQLFFALTPVK